MQAIAISSLRGQVTTTAAFTISISKRQPQSVTPERTAKP